MLFNRELPKQIKILKRKNRKGINFTILFLIVLITLITAFIIITSNLSLHELENGFNMFYSDPQNVSKVVPQVKEKNAPVSDGYSISSIRSSDERYIKLKTHLKEYISKFEGQYGIYFIDLANGREFGINETDEYIAASTVKIPLNLYLYKRIKEGYVNPEDTLTYTEEDYETGTGKIQSEKFGKEYSIRELSKLSITLSDNVATNMLLRLLGRENLKDYMREIGGTVVSYEENTSCPLDMALYMSKVYEFYISDNILGKELINYFENTVYNERIPKLLPKGTKVAHKIGNWPPVAYHDVGIVFARRPYIISIMSKDIKSQKEAYSVIANISKKVYDFIMNSK